MPGRGFIIHIFVYSLLTLACVWVGVCALSQPAACNACVGQVCFDNADCPFDCVCGGTATGVGGCR